MQTLPLWGARSGGMMWAFWLPESPWSRERCFDKLSMTDRGRGEGAGGPIQEIRLT
jgi:hypothetical protein